MDGRRVQNVAPARFSSFDFAVVLLEYWSALEGGYVGLAIIDATASPGRDGAMDVTVIVWLVIIVAILAALIGLGIAIRKRTTTNDDDVAPRRMPDPRDRGFFE